MRIGPDPMIRTFIRPATRRRPRRNVRRRGPRSRARSHCRLRCPGCSGVRSRILSRDRRSGEGGKGLLHLAEPATHADADDPNPLLETKFGVLAVGEHVRRADRRVTRERKLVVWREDPHATVRFFRPRRQHERRLREVQLLGDRLHRARVDAASVAEHREGIARKRTIGEDVDDRVLALHFRLTASRIVSMNVSKTGSLSRGPGAPPGWYSYVRTGSLRRARPSTDPSLRFRDETTKWESAGIECSSTWNSWFWLVMTTAPVRRSCTGWFAP